jgi:hypothetical protein
VTVTPAEGPSSHATRTADQASSGHVSRTSDPGTAGHLSPDHSHSVTTSSGLEPEKSKSRPPTLSEFTGWCYYCKLIFLCDGDTGATTF